ncbi:MAG: glycosyltransferase family 2 protein [Candidatus Omnitrophota bacterium]
MVKKISIIVPVFNERDNLAELNKKLVSVLSRLDMENEIIYVDDGSNDGSADILNEIPDKYNNVRVITLAKNFGQTQAISAGVDNSDGDVIITIDADLQNDPEDIPALLAKLKEGYDMVSGWRVNRQDNLLFKKIPSAIANRISSLLTNVNVHDLGCTLKVYKRTVLEDIDYYGEIHRFLPVFAAMHGATIAEIPVKHHKRKNGKSKYGLSRIYKVILDMFTIMFMWKFLTRPVYLFGGLGMISLGFASFTALFVVIRKMFFGGVWVSPLLFLFVVFSTMGIQFILMGVLGELIIRLYYGARDQKRYKIKRVESSK